MTALLAWAVGAWITVVVILAAVLARIGYLLKKPRPRPARTARFGDDR
ncbi:hypothetical protein [Streptomyces goshikiensis]